VHEGMSSDFSRKRVGISDSVALDDQIKVADGPSQKQITNEASYNKDVNALSCCEAPGPLKQGDDGRGQLRVELRAHIRDAGISNHTRLQTTIIREWAKARG
jgi:hypothetical protein